MAPANAVELLVDFMNLSGTSEYDADIATLYDLRKNPKAKNARLIAELKRRNQWSDADEKRWQDQGRKDKDTTADASAYYSDFQNEYLDDSGWWAIAWLKMYDRTKAEKYLSTAKTIHAHMAKNWRPDKGGGILWCEDADKQRPNSITNSLFLILSARLHQRTKDPEYLSWAEKTLDWIRSNGLYDGTAIVDGPHHHGDYWSYNQGTYIGGLCSMCQATGRADYLDEASRVTESVLDRAGFVLPGGVIVEKIGTRGDAALFKGIFVRYLAQLRSILLTQKLHQGTVTKIDRCILSSASSFLQNSISPDGLYTAEWHSDARDKKANFQTHLSAMIALLGAASVADAPAPRQ